MEYKKQFLKTFEHLAQYYSRHQVFNDFVHLATLEISQTTRLSLGLPKDDADETAYMEIVKR